jgi:hypothetical protein
MIRLLNDSLGGKQGVVKDKVRQAGVVQSYGAHEQRLLFGSNPPRHSAVS